MKKEIVVSEVIQFVGISDLSAENQEIINKISSEEFVKIKRLLEDIVSFVVHIKVYSKNGSKAKFALHIRVISPIRDFESCKSHDWDLTRVLRESFEDLHRQIEHKLGANATRTHIPHQKLGKRKRQNNLL